MAEARAFGSGPARPHRSLLRRSQPTRICALQSGRVVEDLLRVRLKIADFGTASRLQRIHAATYGSALGDSTAFSTKIGTPGEDFGSCVVCCAQRL